MVTVGSIMERGKTMNKKVIAVLMTCCILAGALMTGCGKGKKDSDETTGGQADNQTEATSSGNETESEPESTEDTTSATESEPEETSDPTPDQVSYDEDYEALDKTGRAQYRVDISISRPDAYGLTLPVTGTAHITYKNYSSDTWDSLIVRDYNPANLWEADNPVYGLTSGSDITDYHTAITEVSCNGTSLTFAEQEDPSIVKIDLSEPLAPGESSEIDINFTLQVPVGGVRQSYDTADHLTTFTTNRDVDDIVVALGPFVPNIAAYDDGEWAADPYFADGECFFTRCSDYKVHVEVPEGFSAVSTGDEIQNPDGSYDMSAENVRDFALFAGDTLTYVEGSYNGKVVRVWYPGSQEEQLTVAERSLEIAVNALQVFSDYFGEYAYDSLDVVYGCLSFGGMEYPSIVWITDTMLQSTLLADNPEYADEILEGFIESVVVHEIGHEWFYSCLGNDEYNEPWLDEGFASFCELIYLEETGDPDTSYIPQGWRESRAMCNYAPIDATCGECSGTFESEEGTWDYGCTIYDSGALFLYELRDAMGKDAFEQFMHDWYTDNMNTEVTTELFLTTLFTADDSDAVREVVGDFFRDENIPD